MKFVIRSIDMNNFERGDTPKSLYGVLSLGKQALMTVISSLAERVDTRAASALERPDDE